MKRGATSSFASLFGDDDDDRDDGEPKRTRDEPPPPGRMLQAEHWAAMLGELIDQDQPGAAAARQAVERDHAEHPQEWAERDDDGRDQEDDSAAPAYSRETEVAPLQELADAIADVFNEIAFDSAPLLRALLRRDQLALLTERPVRTRGRHVMHAFRENVRAHLGTEAPLPVWRTGLVGPWAGADAGRSESLETALGRVLADEVRDYHLVADIYHLDDALYVACVYTRDRSSPGGSDYCFEGYLFTQSSQSLMADSARAGAPL